MLKRASSRPPKERPIHPQIQALICFRDNALEPTARDSVAAHLQACAECRRQLDFLCAEPVSSPGLLDALREQIRTWDTQRNQTPEDRAELRRKVLLELAPFIGDAAVARLLQTVSDDGRNLLSTLEPVLARFLGISAASELVSHLVDSAIY